MPRTTTLEARRSLRPGQIRRFVSRQDDDRAAETPSVLRTADRAIRLKNGVLDIGDRAKTTYRSALLSGVIYATVIKARVHLVLHEDSASRGGIVIGATRVTHRHVAGEE
jgi:hypothetical protein